MYTTYQLILYQSINELLASNRRLYEAITSQVESVRAKPANEVVELLGKIKQVLKLSCLDLEAHCKTLERDATFASVRPNNGNSVASAKNHSEAQSYPLSKMLRDDYIELSAMTVNYTMLHTLGMALHDAESAMIALHHLKALTPLLAQILKVVPKLVAQELSGETVEADATVAVQALLNTQKAWFPSHLLGKGTLFAGKSLTALM